MNAMEEFQQEKRDNIAKMNADPNTKLAGAHFQDQVSKYKYGYYFTWMGRPIIQLPQDMITLQEAIMTVKPDLIIETGIAHGGSIIFTASMLELLSAFEPEYPIDREVIGIDIEIRPHNRTAIEAHPMYRRITMLEGSSTDKEIVNHVHTLAEGHETVMVLLDSCHTHAHVLEELKLYSPMVSKGSYIVAYDTAIQFVNASYGDRPWDKGNNPYTAVQDFLKGNADFECDESFTEKSILTSCPGGWLKRIR